MECPYMNIILVGQRDQYHILIYVGSIMYTIQKLKPLYNARCIMISLNKQGEL